MSDHLLRMARIVKEIAVQAPFIDGITRGDAHSLVRDLEAAPQPERPPSSVETALREFAGFISGDIAELHGVEVPRIAESVNRYLNASGPHVPPAPERRTITREEQNQAFRDVAAELYPGETVASLSDAQRRLVSVVLVHCAAAWRLTVEDA